MGDCGRPDEKRYPDVPGTSLPVGMASVSGLARKERISETLPYLREIEEKRIRGVFQRSSPEKFGSGEVQYSGRY